MKPTKAQIDALRTVNLPLSDETDFNRSTLAACIRKGWIEYAGTTTFTGMRRVGLTLVGRTILKVALDQREKAVGHPAE